MASSSRSFSVTPRCWQASANCSGQISSRFIWRMKSQSQIEQPAGGGNRTEVIQPALACLLVDQLTNELPLEQAAQRPH